MHLWYGTPEGQLEQRAKEVELYSFAAHRDPDNLPEPPLDNFGYRRVLAAGEEVLATCRVIPLSVLIWGHSVPIAGLSAVASPAEFRRQGHVKDLLARILLERQKEGDALSLLWPFKYAFYRKLGWELGERSCQMTFTPSHLAGFSPPGQGRYVRLAPDDSGRLDPVYRRWAEGQPLALERSGAWWREGVFRLFEHHMRGTAWELDGQIQAYVIYRLTAGSEGIQLRIRELTADNPEAWRAMWSYVYSHEAQIQAVVHNSVAGDPIFDCVADGLTGSGTARVLPGHMIRSLDAVALLKGMPSSKEVEGRLVLEISDPAPGSAPQVVAVSLREGRVEARPSDDSPQVSLDPGGLGQLVTGFCDVDALLWAGRIKGEPGSLDILSRAFGRAEPNFRELF